MNVTVVDENALREAIATVRNDSSENDWIVANHDGISSIKLAGSGSGGLSEMLEAFEDDNVSYGLLRVTETVEISETVKFVLIHFVGERVPMVKKGRYGVCRGNITDAFFSPSHVDFINISDKDDVTDQIVRRKVAEASGTAIHELESTEGRQVRGFTAKPSAQDSPHIGKATTTNKTPQYKDVKPVSTKSTVMTFNDELKSALEAVRNNEDPITWAIGGYKDGNTKNTDILLVGTGTGGLDEFAAALDDSQAMYGLLRSSDTYEGIETVKFVFVAWVGEKISIMNRARTTVHKGAASEFFA
eukprot:Awhi_evm1s14329